jgi:hypothetical protein
MIQCIAAIDDVTVKKKRNNNNNNISTYLAWYTLLEIYRTV